MKDALAAFLVMVVIICLIYFWANVSEYEPEVNPTACFTGNCVFNNDTGEWGPYEGGHVR